MGQEQYVSQSVVLYSFALIGGAHVREANDRAQESSPRKSQSLELDKKLHVLWCAAAPHSRCLVPTPCQR